MRILQVIHGYPMRYNAGSEVYTQTLSRALAANDHEVHVFTRKEDPFTPDFTLSHEHDPGDERVRLHVVNHARSRDRYRHQQVDARFAEVLDEVQPDVVHIGHLNHLSTSLMFEAARREIPVVFTLHDYWLMCPRGQFMQMFPDDPTDPWARCDRQDDAACARHCYSRYFSGDPNEEPGDLAHWTDWVARRMRHVRDVVQHVDHFIAPSRYLMEHFVAGFGLPRTKVTYLDYGFARSRMENRQRRPDDAFTFGYIGTHIPAKGIDRLLDAFGGLAGHPRLRIWGRDRGQNTVALMERARLLPDHAGERVAWLGEYHNGELVPKVFDTVDAIVVPSVWVENSPLVIHEAQQAGVPVITADVGGMAELVEHEVNGLLFRHREVGDLERQMQRLVDAPDFARRLGERGYRFSADGQIPAIEEHAREVEAIYTAAIQRRDSARVEVLPGPWRITFDTNPDDCNLHCVMCEEHSEHSTRQAVRRAAGRPPRRMPVELIRRVLEDSRGTGLREIIPSTMGEPLLYRHMDDIIDLCAAEGVMLNLTTNGTFPGRGARAWAERFVPVTSDVKVSINGASAATQEAIMVGTRFSEVLDNVREVIRVRDAVAGRSSHRCRVTFQVTFMEDNYRELPAIVRLAAGLGVDRVKGHHLWVHTGAMAEQSMRRDADAIARWNAIVAQAREVAKAHPLPNGRPVLLDNIFPLEPDATEDLVPGGPCPFLGQEAWVNAEGRFDPCCAPDAQRRTLGDFGDLHEASIREIWNSEAYRTLAASYRTRDLCLSCNMRRPVGGER